MGIKFRCPGCDKKLHVKAFLAGKRGVCPHCGAKVRIPKESRSTPAEGSSDQHLADATKAADRAVGAHAATAHTPGAPAAKAAVAKPVQPAASRAASTPRGVADPIGEAPEAVWYVRPPSGGQYGPADGEIMRRWLDEGRVGADSLVWREGWPDWKTATSVFASLRQATSQLLEPGPSQAAAEPLEDPFALDDKKPGTRLGTTRAASRSVGRNVAIVVSLSVVCIALLVALYLVLRNQG